MCIKTAGLIRYGLNMKRKEQVGFEASDVTLEMHTEGVKFLKKWQVVDAGVSFNENSRALKTTAS